MISVESLKSDDGTPNPRGVTSGISTSSTGVKMANILLSFSKNKETLGSEIVSQKSDGVAMIDIKGTGGDASGAGLGAGADDPALRAFHANSPFMKRNDAMFCFKYLVVYIAALMSFAHGANDTANSTATFNAVYTVYQRGITECDSGTAIWILVVAGSCSSLGTIFLGYKVD